MKKKIDLENNPNYRYITTMKKNNATIHVYVNEEEPDEKEYMEGAKALIKSLLKI